MYVHHDGIHDELHDLHGLQNLLKSQPPGLRDLLICQSSVMIEWDL